MSLLVAEVKTHAPDGWQSKQSFDHLFGLATEHGDIVSIHTEAPWGGSLDRLYWACQNTNKPVLAKGVHASDSAIAAAFNAGASYALVMWRVPSISVQGPLPGSVWIEAKTLDQLSGLPPWLAAVWNSRDFSGGGPRPAFAEAREVRPGWLVQASLIRTVADVHPDSNAHIVGKHLPEYLASR